MDNTEQYIEALIFASESSIRPEEISYCLQLTFEREFADDELQTALNNIRAKYLDDKFALQLVHINKGYQFLTKKEYYPIIKQLQLQRSKKKLSQAALETLAIIAYQQPITKGEVEQIRGVNCDYSVQKLLEKELIEIKGKADTVGKPILYGTSQFFMDYFGINDMKQLPQLKELGAESSTIGEQAE